MVFRIGDRPVSIRSGCKSRLCVVACLVALSQGLVGDSVALADAALDDYNVATALYREKRWELAADSFRRFLAAHPRHARTPHARLYLGLSLVNLEKYDQARDQFRGFARDYPQNQNLPDALYRIAECSYFLGDLKAAEGEFATFLTRYPRHDLVEWALPYLADAQLRQKKADAAADNFRQALELYPKGRMVEDVKFGLARAHEALGKPAEAIGLYRELADDRTGERAPQAQFNLGALHFDAENFAEAAAAYVRLAERFPESPLVGTARLNAGYAWYQAGEHRQAVGEFEQAAKDEAQQTAAAYWKGMTHKALAEYPAAREALEAAFDADPQGPLAEQALYHRADCELRAARFDEARELFLDAVRRYPQGELAADSLHFAAEAALRSDRLDEAQDLARRFERERAGHRLQWQHELLQGRLLDARGTENDRRAALDRFRRVVGQDSDLRLQQRARFHLARTYQKLDDHAQAVETIAPLVAMVKAENAAEFLDALVLAGISQLALKNYEAAGIAMSEYLQRNPDGDQAEQALATKAEAAVRAEDYDQADTDLAALIEKYPESGLVVSKLHQAAELAYQTQKWEWSGRWFDRLAALKPAESQRPAALSGLAWSQYQQEQYREAAETFAQVVQEFPDDPAVAPEAAFKQGDALRAGGDHEGAATAYAAAFDSFAPAEAAPEGAERQGAAKYAYLAGLEAARTWRQLEKTDVADAAYDRLFKRFPKAKQADVLLDEWAALHYEAENYDRADDLFGRLVKEFPNSPRADDARFNLAESDYVMGRLDAAREVFGQLAGNEKVAATLRQRAQYNLVRIAAEQRDWKAVRETADQFLSRFADDRELRSHVEFLLGEARLNLDEFEEAVRTLARVKESAPEPATAAEWFPRLWVLLAEAQVRLKNYDQVTALVEEFRGRDAESPFLHQADEILGRSYKNQAKFDQAREAFRRVTEDPHGRRTETAAKSQFLLAETWLIEKDYKTAQTEYFKVYHLYKFPEWQAWALFQAAKCDEAQGQWKDAVKLYDDLLRQFPEMKAASDAKQQLPIARRKAAE